MQVLEWRILFIALAILMAYANASYHLQLSAHEGDRMYLPCFNTPAEPIYYWKIGENVYPVEQLPANNARGLSEGLIIYHATTDMRGNISCYTYGVKGVLQKISSVSLDVREFPSNGATGAELGQSDGTQNLHTELTLRVTKTDTIFIPCRPQIDVGLNLTIWGIDGALYPVLELPPDYTSTFRGIILYNVSSESTYECYGTTQQDTNKIQLWYKVDIRLTERDTTNEGTRVDVNEDRPHLIQIVSRELSINETYFNVGYRIANLTSAPNCTSPGILTEMTINDEDNTLWNDSTSVYKPSFSIPSTIFDDRPNAYGRVDTTNSTGHTCARLAYPFRFDFSGRSIDQCTPEFADGCISLPDDLTSLVVLWPRTPNSDEDCVCGVFLQASPTSPKFEDCYCIRRGLTTYKVVLDETTRELCWKNLTRQSNDTKVLFARDSTLNYTRRYTRQERIIVEDPDPNRPNITQSEPATVCIESKNPDWSPVVSTSVVIMDATKDVIRNDDFPSNYYCEDFNSFPQSCEPFIVTAIAFTHCSHSDESVFHSPGVNGNKTNYCDCLDAKVTLSMIRLESYYDSIVMSFDTFCLNDSRYDVDEISNLHLKVHQEACTKNCTKAFLFTVKCNQTSQSVTATNLLASTAYTVSIVWELPENTSIACPLTLSQTTYTDYASPGVKVAIGIGICVAIGALISGIICIGVTIKRRRRRTYDPGSGETESNTGLHPSASGGGYGTNSTGVQND